MLDKVIKEFDKYTSKYDKSIPLVELKYNHSYAVMELMGKLAISLDLSLEYIELAKIIGLLHDIGRFDQIIMYNCCSDTQSGIDHADYGCNYLFKENHIRDFIDDNKYDSLIDKAIKYHNKLEIPDNLDADELLFTKMIRDMDKVDIYKEEAIYDSVTFDKNDITDKVIEEFRENHIINRKNRKTETDNIITDLGFIFDINFKESIHILNETGYFNMFVNSINVKKDSIDSWDEIVNKCNDYLKKV